MTYSKYRMLSPFRAARTIKIFLRRVCELLLVCVDRFCIVIPLKAHTGRPTRVLLVRPDALGDFILWLDAAKEIRKIYPAGDYEITLLGNSIWSPLAEGMSCFDRIWLIQRRAYLNNPFYRLKLIRRVRSAGFSKAVLVTCSREILGDSIIRMSGAPERIGSSGDLANMTKWQKRISDSWYTRLVPVPGLSFMELGCNAEFVRGLGSEDFRAGIPELHFPRVIPADLQGKEYYVVFPGAGPPDRRWPVQNFSMLSSLIYRATGWVGVICGGRGEESIATALTENCDAPLFNLAGQTSLPDLISVIAGARLLIGNETGAIHIAAAVSTPSVCILGGGHYGRFMPYRPERTTSRPLPYVVARNMDCFGCNWRCIYKVARGTAAPCVDGVSVDMAWEGVSSILSVLKRT
jgi:ADP-heptose:LPS heptosyltransferase